jgi:crossover junction endodeoxyribonuclease RuvC
LTTILGIDPGSRVTGFGVIKLGSNKAHYLASGCIRIKQGKLAARLLEVFEGISELMARYQPDEVSIESVFMHQNAQSALKLGQARGAAMVAVMRYQVEIFEYSPRLIKQAVVGYGGAQKAQVQEMVKSILHLPKAPPSDAADGLAIALTHAQTRKFNKLLQKIEEKT